LISGDVDLLAELFGMVEGAIEFVLRHQMPDGAIRWSLGPDGRPEGYALLTGSSSIYHSLRCAIAIAERLDEHRLEWEMAAGRLGHAVAHHPGAFAPKNEFAMDWYYPILSGAVEGQPATERIERHWDRFVMPGQGVRCVSTSDWVTAAETAECVLVLDALGRHDEALDLFRIAQGHRRTDGAYWTGIAYPELTTFPAHEITSYTAAAIVLAADALSSATPAAGLFRSEGLIDTLDLAGPRCDDRSSGPCTAR
jgi:hypothetical protein